MNHGLKVNGNVLEITLPDGIDIEKVVVNGEVFGEEQDVPDTNVGDMISRQAAIDALKMDISIIPFKKAREYVRAAIETIYNRFEELPSAQPEIIRCKDCRHGVDYYHEGDCYCTNPKLGLMYFGGSWDFYCADAERRTDE